MTRPVATAVGALLLIALTSCVGETGGVSTGYSDVYWGAPVYSYDLNYFYGPPVVYGGWGPGYFVGPPAWPAHPTGWGGPHVSRGRPPPFRPAAAGRPMPSIPSGPRTGGPRHSTSRP